MFRIALVWIYLASLLICPLRCAKSLPLNHEPAGVGQHVHCCSGCLQFPATDSLDDDSLDVSTARLEGPSSSFPDSDCGCLTCVCKSTLYSSKEALSDEVQESPFALPTFPDCPVKRPSCWVTELAETRCELRPYGRGLRSLLQSWLI